MNSASFDVCCLCFWKCLIVAKNSYTYAVCSCLLTVAESCRLMFCSIWIWLQRCPWSCRAMNSASDDVCCLCVWKCLIVGEKFKHLCSLFVSAYRSSILSFHEFSHTNLVARIASFCKAMNFACFDVFCLCFWKCLIVAKTLNTYAVCSCLHTDPHFCRFMISRIRIWLQK